MKKTHLWLFIVSTTSDFVCYTICQFVCVSLSPYLSVYWSVLQSICPAITSYYNYFFLYLTFWKVSKRVLAMVLQFSSDGAVKLFLDTQNRVTITSGGP